MRSLRHAALLTLLAGTVCFSACSDDDTPTNPGTGGNPGPNPTNPAVVSLYNAGVAMQNSIVTPNQAAYASVQFLLPIIAATLKSTPPLSAPSQAECLDPAILGKTFGWIGEGYGETELPGAPETGVRFLLYPIDGTGTPDFATSTGHVDILCPALGAQIGIGLVAVWQGATVLDAILFGVGSYVDMAGTFLANNGMDVLGFTGNLTIGTGTRNYYFVLDLPPGLEHSHSEGHTPASDEIIAVIDVGEYQPTYEWNANTQVNCNTAGDIAAGGVLYFDDGGGSYHIACASGTLPNAAFGPAADCEWGGAEKLALTSEDTAALSTFYATERALYAMFQTLADAASIDAETAALASGR